MPIVCVALAALLAGGVACNSLWGIDDLRYEVDPTGQTGSTSTTTDSTCSESGATRACYEGNPISADVGECRSGISTCDPPTWSACVGQILPATEICDNGRDDDCNGVVDDTGDCCTPSCVDRCPGADDGCGGTCDDSCGATRCCNDDGDCVDGSSDTQCGSSGESCEDCTASSESCGPAGPTLTDPSRTCLPPCAGHLRAAAVTTGALGGTAGADDVCASAFGNDWHLLESWVDTDGVEHGGSDIAGVCQGDWCTDIAWGGVSFLLAAGSCNGLTDEGTASALGVGLIDEICSRWGAGMCDCGDLTDCWSSPVPMGILCTDW